MSNDLENLINIGKKRKNQKELDYQQKQIDDDLKQKQSKLDTLQQNRRLFVHFLAYSYMENIFNHNNEIKISTHDYGFEGVQLASAILSLNNVGWCFSDYKKDMMNTICDGFDSYNSSKIGEYIYPKSICFCLEDVYLGVSYKAKSYYKAVMARYEDPNLELVKLFKQLVDRIAEFLSKNPNTDIMDDINTCYKSLGLTFPDYRFGLNTVSSNKTFLTPRTLPNKDQSQSSKTKESKNFKELLHPNDFGLFSFKTLTIPQLLIKLKNERKMDDPFQEYTPKEFIPDKTKRVISVTIGITLTILLLLLSNDNIVISLFF